MPINIRLSDLAEKIGSGTAGFIEDLAEATRVWSCSIWERFPDQVVQSDDFTNSFVRGIMTQQCADQTLPPLPTPPFTGGQCTYLYSVAFRYGDVPGVPPTLNTGNNVCLQTGIQGPIQAISATTSGSTGTLIVTDANGVATQCTGPYDPGQDTAVFVIPPFGFPDNCGDPPPDYPSTNPQPADYQTTVNLNLADGTTVNYDLEYMPTNYNFPMEFNLGGISLTIDLGGINFNFSLIGVDGVPLPLPNGNTAPLPTPIDDNNRQFPPPRALPPDDQNYDEEERTESDPKEEEVGAEIEFVKVTLTSFPSNIKNQFGDGAPDVLYAGWFEFQAEGYNFPRQPIHFNNCIYRKPEGATGYAYTLYEGISGRATIYKLKQEA